MLILNDQCLTDIVGGYVVGGAASAFNGNVREATGSVSDIMRGYHSFLSDHDPTTYIVLGKVTIGGSPSGNSI